MTGKKKIKDANYGTKTAVQSGKGIVDYNPDKMSDVVGGEKLTYDEYLEIQRNSQGKVRGSFQRCYYEIPLGFRGEVERITKDKICFKRIFVEGMYCDGICFDGLMAIIRDTYLLDPYANALFLFCGHDSRKIKALHYDKLSADFCYPHIFC